MSHGVPTVGVEEEFLLIDKRTLEPASVAGAVAYRLPEELSHRIRTEFYACQLELVTDPCQTADELEAQLRQARLAAVVAADAENARILATAYPPMDSPTPPRWTWPQYMYRLRWE